MHAVASNKMYYYYFESSIFFPFVWKDYMLYLIFSAYLSDPRESSVFGFGFFFSQTMITEDLKASTNICDPPILKAIFVCGFYNNWDKIMPFLLSLMLYVLIKYFNLKKKSILIICFTKAVFLALFCLVIRSILGICLFAHLFLLCPAQLLNKCPLPSPCPFPQT